MVSMRGVKKHGTPLERLMRKCIRDEATGCLLWQGALNRKNGYGQIYVNGRKVMIHVFVYEHFVGPVPPGKELDHTCRTRTCAEHTHLEPVTHAENLRRGSKTVHPRCPAGHLLSGDRINGRFCRACARQRREKTRW